MANLHPIGRVPDVSCYVQAAEWGSAVDVGASIIAATCRLRMHTSEGLFAAHASSHAPSGCWALPMPAGIT